MHNINKYEGSVSVDAKVDANVSIVFFWYEFQYAFSRDKNGAIRLETEPLQTSESFPTNRLCRGFQRWNFQVSMRYCNNNDNSETSL